jgi:aminoglycoside phosphotransferase (APT) family kinase protein
MHADELRIDGETVRRLLAEQAPQWVELSLTPMHATGTDNAVFRLGDDMVVRLPRTPSAAAQAAKEQEWLPRLAPQLPVPVPVPLLAGEAGAGYPWRWSVTRWFHGQPASPSDFDPADGALRQMTDFIAVLQRIDASGGPIPGEHNFGRGVPLVERDDATRAAIDTLARTLDAAAITEAWNEALAAPSWSAPPVWLHGDLLAGNVLVADGRLTAVIDFGGLAVGDPACDLMVAWTLLPASRRSAFREVLAIDDSTWARARGWALSWALIYIPYYLDTDPLGVGRALRTVAEVLNHR